jgi:putative addiction module CopG family antidote
MEIHIRPDLEELIKQDVKRGPYKSVDQYVEEALSILHEREAWLAQHRSEIQAKIEEGYASAEREGFLSPEQLEARLREWKTSRSAQKP